MTRKSSENFIYGVAPATLTLSMSYLYRNGK